MTRLPVAALLLACASLFGALPLSAAGMGSTALADASDGNVRFFRIWSVHRNAPQHEIAPSELEGRRLGYWAVRFDDDGATREATFHSSAGTPQVTFRYVDVDGRVYADFFAGDGHSDAQRLGRKGTLLSDRMPRWDPGAASP